MAISGSQENVPTTRDVGIVPADVYTGYANVITAGGIVEPKLIDLRGDQYSRRDFNVLNDAEFTELLSSIEGIGVSEFFSLYEELKLIIPGGTLDIAFSVDTPTGVFRLIDEILTLLKPEDKAEFTALMTELRGKISSLTDAISNATPESHAYLVQTSMPWVDELNKRFKAVFDRIIELMLENANLRAENEALKAEIEELNKQITQLTDLIIKLTAPPSSAFQIVPDLFTKETQGATWKAGNSVELVVCGSAKYSFVAAPGYASKFTWTQVEGTSRWIITTDVSLAGKTTYITAIADDTPSQISAKATEQIVFVFPPTVRVPGGEPGEPGETGLQSSVGNLIGLNLPDDLTDWHDFESAGYKNTKTVVISGGTPPYTVRVNVPASQQFFTVNEGLLDT